MMVWPFKKKNKDLEDAIILFYAQFPRAHPQLAPVMDVTLEGFDLQARRIYQMSYDNAVAFNCEHDDAHESAMFSVFAFFSGLGLSIGWADEEET